MGIYVNDFNDNDVLIRFGEQTMRCSLQREQLSITKDSDHYRMTAITWHLYEEVQQDQARRLILQNVSRVLSRLTIDLDQPYSVFDHQMHAGKFLFDDSVNMVEVDPHLLTLTKFQIRRISPRLYKTDQPLSNKNKVVPIYQSVRTYQNEFLKNYISKNSLRSLQKYV